MAVGSCIAPIELAERKTLRSLLAWFYLIDRNIRLDAPGLLSPAADLARSNLEGARLIDARLSKVDLCGANLERIDLRGARLEGARLERANLRGARLEGSDLREVDLREANLEGASLEARPSAAE